MPAIADRVRDSSSTTGTGAITLDGTPPSGYRTFAAGFGSAAVMVGYCIVNGTEWEVGKGVFDGNVTLTRSTVRSSSNGNALVNFSAGTKDVFCTAPAELLDNANIGLILAQSRGMAMP